MVLSDAFSRLPIHPSQWKEKYLKILGNIHNYVFDIPIYTHCCHILSVTHHAYEIIILVTAIGPWSYSPNQFYVEI